MAFQPLGRRSGKRRGRGIAHILFCPILFSILCSLLLFQHFSIVNFPLWMPMSAAAVTAAAANDDDPPLPEEEPPHRPAFQQATAVAFPPGQTPGPPAIRPPEGESERTARMLERAKDFVRRYLTLSDLRHLQQRLARVRQQQVSNLPSSRQHQRIRHAVWHFLADTLSPEQKVELGAEKARLWMDFA